LILSIASGKGGTGKTLVATSLAVSLPNAQLLDCDVEEPNAFLFFPNRALLERTDCQVPVPVIDVDRCVHCGKCSDACAFNALAALAKEVLVFPELCHGCGGCVLACPEKAVKEGRRPVGQVFRARSGGHDLVWGELRIGEARTTPLIRAVRERASGDIVIVDCPPGTSCSLVEAVRGTDFCLLVTEPTPFGLYDLDLALKVLEKMEIPRGVLVNKSGIGDRKVYEYLQRRKIPLLMEIPMSREIAELYSRGRILAEAIPGWRERFAAVAEAIREMIP
jgi:MinD superfamily P-loop ATPase